MMMAVNLLFFRFSFVTEYALQSFQCDFLPILKIPKKKTKTHEETKTRLNHDISKDHYLDFCKQTTMKNSKMALSFNFTCIQMQIQ